MLQKDCMQANVKVGENDVHSTEELKLWVRPQSAFHLTVGKYIQKAF